ncbi:MAG TPA: BPL-N domain-containing protein [Bdellovibrionota bacterium]|nr:BPL-N domain-containing protein [Bdellovibrionota bacterium]
MKSPRMHLLALLAALALATTACESDGTSLARAPGGGSDPANPGIPGAPADPGTPPETPRAYTTAALLFNGSGAWTSEVANLKTVLSSHGLSYKEVTSAQVSAMTVDEMASYGMFVWPGGSGTQMLSSLNGETRKRIRSAVVDRGVGFVGFCAGAFLAVSPAPSGTSAPAYFSLIPAPILDYYYLENQGVTWDMTTYTFADGSRKDIVWYGGPVTPDIQGGVVAKYPTGEPAITQFRSGKGFVIVSGGHPASPDLGIGDTDGVDLDIAWLLLNATLSGKPLPAFGD